MSFLNRTGHSKMNKRVILYILLLMAGASSVAAQNVPSETSAGEVEYAGMEVQVDSSLIGMDIFSILPEDVVVIQDASVRAALAAKIESAPERLVSGFRIRLFSSSSRTAREASLEVLRRFNEQYPFISVYRSYSAPNFKVTIGNFRNRAEAEAVHRLVKKDYPDAFIVRDRFRYPTIGRSDMSTIVVEEE